MNEPFYPFPIPSPPENGVGAILRRVVGRLADLIRRSRPRESRLASGPTTCCRRSRQLPFPILPPLDF